MDKEKLGAFVQMLRKEQQMTQKELAREVGVNVYTIGLWEKNINPCPAHRLRKLCELFGVSMDYLVGRSEARK